jgi:hypothetical protein
MLYAIFDKMVNFRQLVDGDRIIGKRQRRCTLQNLRPFGSRPSFGKNSFGGCAAKMGNPAGIK